MRMNRMICLGVLALASATALAGSVLPQPVTVTLNADGSGTAFGDMGTARFSSNTVELIGCGVRRFDDGVGGVFFFAFCQATSAGSVAGFCSTEHPGLAEAVSALSDYSFITFSWNADGTCRTIGSSTQSFYLRR
jgi:hypothetical protein